VIAKVNKEDGLRFVRSAISSVTSEVDSNVTLNVGLAMSLESLFSNLSKEATLDFLAALETAIGTFQNATNFEINLNISQHGGLDAQILTKTKENYDAAKKIEEVSKPALVASSQG
jgi:hypothetical protein